MKITLNNKVYDVLKWLVLVALPAASVLYAALARVWGWGYAGEVTTTVAAVCAFLGTLIGISTAAYRKEEHNGGQQ